jgi:hypothetical protein
MPKVNKREMKKEVGATTSTIPTTVAELDEISTASTVPLPTGGFDGTFADRRRLVLTTYKGQTYIHVREYVNEDGREYPSKKGVCFTPSRLQKLCHKIEEIDEQLRQRNATASYKVDQGEIIFKTHLGAGIYASVGSKFNGVDLRRFWAPPGQFTIVPTKNGIFLPVSQWSALKKKLDELLTVHPELTRTELCLHQNQMDVFQCHECMPFGILSI